MKRVIAIDGNALLFAAYHATKDFVKPNSKGEYTNALDTFIRMINKIINNNHFDYIMVAFDASSKTFRTEQFEDYKGTRVKTDDALIKQFPLVREYLDYVGIENYEVLGYEADDILGTIAKEGSKKGYKVDIITADKDLLQLIDENVNILLKRRNSPDPVRIEMIDGKLSDIWPIKPKQVIDLKSLWGDPSDNIPGVSGIGEKGAMKLLDEYDTLENIYDNLDKFKGKRLENLINDKDKAFMSQELATIITDVELPFEIEDLSVKESDVAKLKNLYHTHELNRLLAEVQDESCEECEITYEVVNSFKSEQLLKDSYIDFVSLSDYYHRDAIMGLIIINESGNYFMDTLDIIKDESLLKFLKNEDKQAYDLKKNKVIAHWHGIKLDNIKEDVLIGSYLIDSSKELEPSALVDTNFNVVTINDKQILKEETEVQIENKVKQAFYLKQLVEKNKDSLEELELEELYQVELKVAYILSNMEEEGILLDKAELKELDVSFNEILSALETEIYTYATKKFNINSVKQLGEVLFDTLNLRVIKKTKTGYSTDNDVLSELENDHPIIPLIVKYRTYKKLLSTYIEPMADFILEDNRIHTIYNQCLTATGRLSSKEPNLQNIATRSDLQKSIKKMFVAKDGYSLLSFDYSQIELRVLASFSKDPVFIAAFENDEDIHKITAAKVANKELDEVEPSERKAAKAINFGIIYGLSDFGLARQIGVMRNEAKDFIDKYYETYPTIKDYMDSLIESTIETGYAKTILNRIRYIDEIKSNNYNIKESGKRMAMNTPIQGSAADILKLAMIKIDDKIQNSDLDIKMLLQVHDELIFEVNDDDIEESITMIKSEMENAYDLGVKLKVDYGLGHSWYNL
ncbi:MAG: DNA polymerase I [Erysipelotrichales bacterium]